MNDRKTLSLDLIWESQFKLKRRSQFGGPLIPPRRSGDDLEVLIVMVGKKASKYVSETLPEDPARCVITTCECDVTACFRPLPCPPVILPLKPGKIDSITLDQC